MARVWTLRIRIPYPLDVLQYGIAWALCALAFRRAGWPTANVRVLALPMATERRGQLLTVSGIRREWQQLTAYTGQAANC